MATIYISYSTRDFELVEPYIRELQRRGHTLAYDKTILHPGMDFQRELLDALANADGMLVFLTESSVASKYVLNEIEFAAQYLNEKPPSKFLIPLALNDVSVPPVIERLLRLYLGKSKQALTDNIDQIIAAIDLFERRRAANLPTSAASAPTTAATAPTTTATAEAVKTAAAASSEPASASPAAAADSKSEPASAAAASPPGPPPPSSLTKHGPTVTRYWLLKINELNWSVADMAPGNDYFFNTKHQVNNDDPDYPHFNEVRPGDEVAMYAFGTTNAIVAVFEITRAVHEDPSYGKIISLKVSRVITPPIPLDRFKDLIDFSASLSPTVNEKLFSLPYAIFVEITDLLTRDPNDQPPPSYPIRFNKKSYTKIAADGAGIGLKDELGFQADYEALAAVIAYKEFTPPLAIGLFGNWGSGKSFFMNKLENEIKVLTQKDRTTYCTNIRSVHFNSWHYSDANLWASLVTKIFDELKTGGDNNVPDKVTEIFSQLKSTLQLRAETETKKEAVDEQIKLLEAKKGEVETNIRTQAERLSSLSIVDIVRGVMQSQGVQSDIDKVKREFSFVQLNEYKDIEASYNELDTATTHLSKGLSIVYSMRRGKLPWALATAFGVWLISYLLIKKVDPIKQLFDEIKAILIPGTVVLTQFLLFIRPGLKKVNDAYDRLTALRSKVKQLEEEKIRQTNKEREEVKANLELAKNQQLELTQQIAQLETKSKMLEKEISDIASGKKLESFIESRVTDARYTSSLGIISWIRKDFDELDKLLQEQRAALDRLGNPPEKEKDFFIIDRIVLYIDDLDRCDADIVVKVLEAIHLLLAFPLFVVVVGVDPRWMHNALNLKYKDFLLHGAQEGGGPPARSAAGAERLNANSYDYLEKIFQIPIVLKPIDTIGKGKLIRSLFSATPGAPGSTVTPPAPVDPLDTVFVRLVADPTQPAATAAASEVPPPPTPPPTPAPEPIRSKEELLKVSDEEIIFMQEIGFLVGDSPRTIKRFINIYRIIRTHDQFIFIDNDEYSHYCAAMIILGIITGASDEAKDLFEKIQNARDHILFRDFLQAIDIPGPAPAFAVTPAAIPAPASYSPSSSPSSSTSGSSPYSADPASSQPMTRLSKLSAFRPPTTGLDQGSLLSAMPQGIFKAGLITMQKFKANFDLVCRFSFRDFS